MKHSMQLTIAGAAVAILVVVLLAPQRQSNPMPYVPRPPTPTPRPEPVPEPVPEQSPVVPTAPASAEASCGGPGVVAALRALKRCAEANGVCIQTGSRDRVNLDVDDLFAASKQFPVSAHFFEVGKTEISDVPRLVSLLDGNPSDGVTDVVCIGSASPTARRDKVDHDLAGARAYGCREIVIGAVRQQRAQRPGTRAAIPSIEQVNVGRALPENYCEWLDDDSRRACEQRDGLARRQVVLAIAYPRRCTATEPSR